MWMYYCCDERVKVAYPHKQRKQKQFIYVSDHLLWHSGLLSSALITIFGIVQQNKKYITSSNIEENTV